MSDTLPATEQSVFLPSPDATVKIHHPLHFSDELLWGAHLVFAVLALIGVVLIFAGRGPRRSEANELAQSDSTPLSAPVAEQSQV